MHDVNECEWHNINIQKVKINMYRTRVCRAKHRPSLCKFNLEFQQWASVSVSPIPFDPMSLLNEVALKVHTV